MSGKTGFLDENNSSLEPLTFNKDDTLDIEDLKSLVYFKVKQSTLQNSLNYHDFRPLQVLCEELNKLTNTLKRGEQ